ncbi:MAG: acyl-CoA dehydrogenase family protein [Pseudomonadota bacterium]
MEFALSDDQKMLQDSIAGTLSNISSLDDVRKVAAGDVDASDISAGLADLGTAQLLIPEADGGLGLSVLDAALVQEALGYHVSPAHFFAGSAVAVTALRVGGGEAAQAEWFPKVASNEVRLAMALTEAVNRREDAGFIEDGGRVSGKALFALETDEATHVLSVSKGGRLFVAPLGDGVTVRRLTTIDRTRTFTELVFEGVEPVWFEESSGEMRALDRTIALGRILLAADTLGAAQAMLDKAVEYAKQRKQFGRVIGSFQAVKHMCAEMAARLEPCRALVWHASYLFDAEPERAALMACHAKAHTSEVGTFVARTATEVYGGMGFTDLVGLHYWFKRIGVNRQLLGGPEVLRSEAARLQGF